jgi:putative transcriptional regulator
LQEASVGLPELNWGLFDPLLVPLWTIGYVLAPRRYQVTNRLRVLRAERQWSQADLAARLGVSRQTVNAIETGKYDPSLPLAMKIARLFKSPIERIFEEGTAAGGEGT